MVEARQLEHEAGIVLPGLGLRDGHVLTSGRGLRAQRQEFVLRGSEVSLVTESLLGVEEI